MLSVKEQLRKSLLEVCTSEDLQEWFDPLDFHFQPPKTSEYDYQAKDDPDWLQKGGAEKNGAEKDGGVLTVTLPHILFADWFDKKGRDLLESTVTLFAAQAAAENEDAASPTIRYEAPENLRGGEDFSAGRTLWRGRKNQKEIVRDSKRNFFTFDEFVTNAKHRNTLHVLRNILPSTPRKVSPVVLYGPPGSGKTHLFVASSERLTEILGSGINRLSGDELTPDLLKEQIRGLLVDNVHLIAPDEAIQNAFVRTLERQLEAGTPVLLAGTGRPSEWPLQETLRSRLHAGVVLALPEPDMDMCLRYVQQRAKTIGLLLERETSLHLARRFPDIRRLEGALRRLETMKTMLHPYGGELTHTDVEQLASHADGPGISAQAIMHLVGEHLEVNPKDMLGSGRKPKVVLARQVAMFLCRELLGHSFPVIGQLFGGKDHSTAIHAVRRIKQLQASNSVTNILVTELMKRCRKLSE